MSPSFSCLLKKAPALALGAALMILPGLALAQGHRRDDDHDNRRWQTGPGYGGPRWHGDIHHFHDYDLDFWRGGRWFEGPHAGRHGWWWIVGGNWYFYNAPAYPYPDPLTPGVVVETVAPGASVYWYCANPAGYYPYIAQCYTAWQKVLSAGGTTTIVTQPPAPVMTSQAVPVVTATAPQAQQPQQTGLSPRESDKLQLNAFAAEFESVGLGEKHRTKHLKDLKARIETFRKSLFERDYNAMDLLKETERLKERIAADLAAKK